MELTIYMKSGNQINIDRVKDWKIRYDSDKITYIFIEQIKKGLFKCKRKLIVKSIDLKQIECIVEH